jgi:hypothetical protein
VVTGLCSLEAAEFRFATAPLPLVAGLKRCRKAKDFADWAEFSDFTYYLVDILRTKGNHVWTAIS